MNDEYDQPTPTLRRPAEQDISFNYTWAFLVVGLFPLGMFVQFWLWSGTGIHLGLVGFVAALMVGFGMALNYFLEYRRCKPRSALVPAAWWKALLVAAILMPIGAYNMLATTHNLGLTLSPGPKLDNGQMASTVAKIVGTALSPGMMKPIKIPPYKKLDVKRHGWLTKRPYLNGALWGALGYALPFGLAGMIFSLLRKEIPDPRDEHIGAGPAGALVRGVVGYYYGSALGFALGASLIFLLRTLFPSITSATPPMVLHWIYTLGAASNPNLAFTYAFSTGCMLAGALALFGGKGDFTAGISDPKAPELTRPVEVLIPEIPPPPHMPFDMGRVQAESKQILSQFSQEVEKLMGGPEWAYERYDLPAVGRNGNKSEPEATNLISARNQESDYDDVNAMGSLSNVYVQIVADLGKLEINAADWLALAENAILELPKSPDGTINVSINGKPAGKGRPLTVNGNKAVKVVSLRTKVENMVRTSG